ncbi:Type IV pilin PilA [Lysobacter dokdonensis DS-58]|uniref:Type IV pilin PilA n=1 Tax=Lysobacter dokdonensis DS-58 TaxID=1300345 RepID=A0A0A2WGB5_9GAMM|nr:pilin [Lysobacter dokdonensis]KGQ18843.1 Type IV pilin PilA [Lysobacter dokdonensis DS-58]
MKKQQGFTLIELMIVVAIIAILAAIAISQYQDYVIRSQVSEGSALADGVKTAMAEYRQNTGAWPANNPQAGLAPDGSILGNYVTSVNVGAASGQVLVTYGGKAHANIDGDTVIFSAIDNGGSISWTCHLGSVDDKYRATSCKN